MALYLWILLSNEPASFQPSGTYNEVAPIFWNVVHPYLRLHRWDDTLSGSEMCFKRHDAVYSSKGFQQRGVTKISAHKAAVPIRSWCETVLAGIPVGNYPWSKLTQQRRTGGISFKASSLQAVFPLDADVALKLALRLQATEKESVDLARSIYNRPN